MRCVPRRIDTAQGSQHVPASVGPTRPGPGSPVRSAGGHSVGRAAASREARRGAAELLAYGMDHAPSPLKEDERQTRRDVRAALVFGIVAATIELGVILYFFW